MKKAIIYTRVATNEQPHTYSLTYQEEKLRKYCATKGIEVVKHYHECFSAKTFDRPEFKLLFEYAKKNKADIDYLLVLKWDRFSRNFTEAITKVKEFKKLKIEVNAIEQYIDYSIPECSIVLAMYLLPLELVRTRKKAKTTLK